MNEDWELLVSFLPSDWRELADDTGALKGLRKDKSVDSLLRTLLIHLGCGHSLRETAVRARQANLADLSDVALLKRLKKSEDWLYALCVRLFQEHGIAVATGGGFQVRAFDATTVKEPGKTGALWRIHYSVCLPSLACDFFKLTRTEGPGTGESLTQFPIRAGDYVLADRGYSTARGIGHVAAAGGQLIVRVNTGALLLQTTQGEPFDLLAAVSSLQRVGAAKWWSAQVVVNDDRAFPSRAIAGRVYALRKSTGVDPPYPPLPEPLPQPPCIARPAQPNRQYNSLPPAAHRPSVRPRLPPAAPGKSHRPAYRRVIPRLLSHASPGADQPSSRSLALAGPDSTRLGGAGRRPPPCRVAGCAARSRPARVRTLDLTRCRTFQLARSALGSAVQGRHRRLPGKQAGFRS